MVTPKILGLLLLWICLLLLIFYLFTGIKLVLFYSLMFLLFGGACFKHMHANINLLKGKTIFIYNSSSDVSIDICRILLDIGAHVIYGISPHEVSSFPLTHDNLVVIALAGDNVALDTQMNLMKDKLNDGGGQLHAVIALPICDMSCYRGRVADLDIGHAWTYISGQLLSRMAVTQLLLPVIQRSQGRLVFMTKYSGRISSPTSSVLCMAEHALESFCDCLRRELIYDDVPISLIEIPNTFTKNSTKAVLESLAAPCPKDRYLIGKDDALFDLEKLKLIIYEFLPTSLVDSFMTEKPISSPRVT